MTPETASEVAKELLVLIQSESTTEQRLKDLTQALLKAVEEETERCAVALKNWAQERWLAAVLNRYPDNKQYAVLDQTWKQVERDGPAAIRSSRTDGEGRVGG